MCIDFHTLNQQTCKNVYSIPYIEDLLDKLAYAKWFLKIDLAQGYQQAQVMPVH